MQCSCAIFFICDLSGCTVFSRNISQTAWFSTKKKDLKCVFWFSLQLLSETFLILRRTERDIIKMYNGLHVQYRLILSDCKENWIFSTDFRKIFIYQISWKSFQWEASNFKRMDKRTDMTKLIVTFRKFVKAPGKKN